MARRRSYKALSVNQLVPDRIVTDAMRLAASRISIGIDVSKHELFVVFRIGENHFSRPVKVLQPSEIGTLVSRLAYIHERVPIQVGLESTGTYGDAIRCALHKAGFEVFRVSGKAVQDYEEIFDGVPSKHDGKDAAMIAELLAFGKATPWPWKPVSDADQRMAHAVDRLDIYSRMEAIWRGRLEALLARHWPEVTAELELKSATLVRLLQHYGGPAGMSDDNDAAAMLRQWGRGPLKADKIDRIVKSAGASVGVPMSQVDCEWMQEVCGEILRAREVQKSCRRTLKELASNNEIIQRMAVSLGEATACVLWTELGDPRNYPCAAAYVKAAGLNLKVRSSGKQKGQLHISRRGPSRVRKWMYFAALRAVQQPAVKPWFDAHKATGGQAGAMKATIGAKRKLLRAVWHTAVTGEAFLWELLFPGRPITDAMRQKRNGNAVMNRPQGRGEPHQQRQRPDSPSLSPAVGRQRE